MAHTHSNTHTHTHTHSHTHTLSHTHKHTHTHHKEHFIFQYEEWLLFREKEKETNKFQKKLGYHPTIEK
jgi:metabotropic glutamate receptor 6/7/8